MSFILPCEAQIISCDLQVIVHSFQRYFLMNVLLLDQILMNASLNHVSMEEDVPITLVATPVLVPGDTEE